MTTTSNHGPSAIPSSRRRFLKQATGTAAAFTVPNIVTGPLFGAAAPSNRIAVGQIGCGSIADYYHLPIFRTLAQWDVTCDYANGVKLRVMDCRTAKASIAASLPREWQDGDGVIFHGSEGWSSDALGFCASNQTLWKAEAKSSDEQLPVTIEHHRNFIDCVKSRQETICPVEMAIRADTIAHLCNVAARTGRAIGWNPEKEEITGDPEAAKMLTRPSREKWRVW